jgi:hypothetical protein
MKMVKDEFDSKVLHKELKGILLATRKPSDSDPYNVG